MLGCVFLSLGLRKGRLLPIRVGGRFICSECLTYQFEQFEFPADFIKSLPENFVDMCYN